MNILVCNNFVRQGSGVDGIARMEVRALRTRAHRVRVFGIDNAVLDHAAGPARARLLASCLYSLPARRALEALLDEQCIDVAYVHNTVPLLTGSVYDALRGHGVLTIQHLHNLRAFCLNSYAYRDGRPCVECERTAFTACTVHRCYRDSLAASATLSAARLIDAARGRNYGYDAHAYIAGSDFTKQEHVRHGLDEDRIFVLHNPGEDLAAVLDSGKTRQTATPMTGRPHKKITYVGSLLRAKGVYMVLDLAAALPDWEVQLIGAGPEEAGLSRAVAARSLGNVSLRGLLVGSAKAHAWHDSLVTVVPSLCDETSPLVVRESYSLGIPVVSTGSGGMAETVRDGETGFLQSFRDPRETAALLRALRDDTVRYNAMSAAQKQKVSAATQAAIAYNNDNRIKEEAQLVDFFKKEGLQVTTPDVEAFRKTVQAAYQNSEYAKVWPKGLVERINAVK